LFNIIKIAWWLYLLYIGIQAIRYADSSMDLESQEISPTQKTWRWYLIQWFIVNVLNPKAALYFVALFTTFVPVDASNLFLMYLAIAVVVTTALRFVLIANIIGLPIVRSWFVRYTKWINRICGWLLWLFGLKLMAMHK
jgi:threonine/homoserine/homoserine lactone efflux protein